MIFLSFLRKAFLWSASPKRHRPTEETLKNLGVRFELRPDGTYFVPGLLSIPWTSAGIKALPDLSRVHVGGNFNCTNLKLTSLKGAPASVGGIFDCSMNRLTSLEHGPAEVGFSYVCRGNRLTTLKHAPPSLKGQFVCDGNKLLSLRYISETLMDVKSDFGVFENSSRIPDHLLRDVEKENAIKDSISCPPGLEVDTGIISVIKRKLRL